MLFVAHKAAAYNSFTKEIKSGPKLNLSRVLKRRDITIRGVSCLTVNVFSVL